MTALCTRCSTVVMPIRWVLPSIVAHGAEKLAGSPFHAKAPSASLVQSLTPTDGWISSADDCFPVLLIGIWCSLFQSSFAPGSRATLHCSPLSCEQDRLVCATSLRPPVVVSNSTSVPLSCSRPLAGQPITILTYIFSPPAAVSTHMSVGDMSHTSPLR